MLFAEEAPPPKQQIVCSRSFVQRITAYDELRQAISQYAERVAEKLRGERQYCRHISAFVKTSPFAVKEPYYGNISTEKLSTPTRYTRDIIAAAINTPDRIWLPGHRYAKAGVMLNDFSPNGVSHLNLFDEMQPQTHSDELMNVLHPNQDYFHLRQRIVSRPYCRMIIYSETPLQITYCFSEDLDNER